MRRDRLFLTATLLLAAATAFLPRSIMGATLDPAHAKEVTVRMTEYKFIPNHLAFKRGVLYRLHLVNEGKEIHEFTAPDFIAAIDLKNPQALGPYTNQFAVDPGASKDVYFIPRRPGQYGLICADHDWAGMTGGIAITP